MAHKKEPQKRRKKPVGEICNNYLKPCPIMGRCNNCKNRRLHISRSTGEQFVTCGAGEDVDGEHSACFVCSSEGYCKKYD